MHELIAMKCFETDTEKILTNTKLLELREWKVREVKFPIFVLAMTHPRSKKEYTFRFLCDDYPISMQIVDSQTFLPVDISRCPQGGSFLQNHTTTHLPFLCTPQLREYHTHTSHNKEPWVFSAESRLPSILEAVYFHLGRANM